MRRGTAIFTVIFIVFLSVFSNLSFLGFNESEHENYENAGVDDGLPVLDSDGDGIPDGWELFYDLDPLDASDALLDIDGDGWDFNRDGNIDEDEIFTNLEEFKSSTDPRDPDTDNDHMWDGWEVHYDLDPEVEKDAEEDLDNDGYDANRNGRLSGAEFYTNREEFEHDTNPNNTDSDNDQMWDGWEVHYDLDPLDPSDSTEDPDDDGGEFWVGMVVRSSTFTNRDEFRFDTDPFNNDTDGDTMQDGWEAASFGTKEAVLSGTNKYKDPDNDGLVNVDEYLNYFDVDGILHSNPNASDTDGDGLLDGNEIHGTNIQNHTFTATYVTDPTASDTDYDSMPDGWELNYTLGWMGDDDHRHFLDPTSNEDRYEDPDNDGFDFNFNGKITGIEQFFNYLEYLADTNPFQKDFDEDGMPDGYEALQGLNPKADDRFLDFDNDSYDGDGNGVIQGKENMSNIREYEMGILAGFNDSDLDGMPDGWEVYYDLAPKDFRDADLDKDNDGFDVNRDGFGPPKDQVPNEWFTNLQEYLNDTNPNSTDTDGDGMWDGWEAYYDLDPKDPKDTVFDPDNDGINNSVEFTNSFDVDNILQTNPLFNDTDLDGISDGHELNGTFGHITDPTTYDTDRDEMPDGWEIVYGLDPRNPLDAELDLDNDDLSNLGEYRNGTRPDLKDTEEDGMWDGWEVKYELNPLFNDSYNDSDEDGLMNLLEFSNPITNDSDGVVQTDPTDTDTDNDGLSDGDEVLATFGFVTDPTSNDTDSDRLNDYEEYVAGKDNFTTVPTLWDSDGDGMPDGWETNFTKGWYGDDGERHILDPNDASDEGADPDSDGFDANFDDVIDANEMFTNRDEFQYGSNPFLWDTNRNGIADGFEAYFEGGR